MGHGLSIACPYGLFLEGPGVFINHSVITFLSDTTSSFKRRTTYKITLAMKTNSQKTKMTPYFFSDPNRHQAPRVNVSPSRNEVSLGGTLHIVCVATGNPEPEVTWKWDQNQPPPAEQISVIQRVLSLSNISRSATFTCEAGSEYGVAYGQAEVFVRG